jgi:hypothetical protein
MSINNSTLKNSPPKNENPFGRKTKIIRSPILTGPLRQQQQPNEIKTKNEVSVPQVKANESSDPAIIEKMCEDLRRPMT